MAFSSLDSLENLLNIFPVSDDPFLNQVVPDSFHFATGFNEVSDVTFFNNFAPAGNSHFLTSESSGPPDTQDSGTQENIRKSVKRKEDDRSKVAFRTMSEVEIMDDGFRWRKYGKKSVKDSPNPRNYYRCSNGDCNVKKRVERDGEDSRYVMTTYEGLHNHDSPYIIYYISPSSSPSFRP